MQIKFKQPIDCTKYTKEHIMKGLVIRANRKWGEPRKPKLKVSTIFAEYFPEYCNNGIWLKYRLRLSEKGIKFRFKCLGWDDTGLDILLIMAREVLTPTWAPAHH